MNLNRIPIAGTDIAPRDPASVERREKGTNLNSAVVLEKDRKQKREQRNSTQLPQQPEQPFEIYNSEASSEVVNEESSSLDITA